MEELESRCVIQLSYSKRKCSKLNGSGKLKNGEISSLYEIFQLFELFKIF